MKLAWCTDTHFDHVREQDVVAFAKTIVADAVLFTGDISCADYIEGHLSTIRDVCGKPIYVVLGNHDFYGSDTTSVREKVSKLEGVCYLSVMKPVELAPETTLVGHDGWYDLYHGNGTSTSVVLNDFMHIRDFLPFFYQGAVEIPARELAREAAAYISKQIDVAAKKYQRIIVATHVPPWPQASTYRGKQSNDDFLPLFCSKVMGGVLDQASKNYPGVEFTVLAGHSHGRYDGFVHPNMRCKVGGAEYGQPTVQEVLEIV